MRVTEIYNEAEAEQARQDAVDLLEEEREMALIRSTIYQQDLRRFHARNVRGRAFQEGDLVLRVDQHKPHKLAPSWEGPFIVTKVLHNGAYRLYNVEHNIDEPRAWNAELLRPFDTIILKSMNYKSTLLQLIRVINLKCKMGGVVPHSKLGARRYYARRCKDGTPRCGEPW